MARCWITVETGGAFVTIAVKLDTCLTRCFSRSLPAGIRLSPAAWPLQIAASFLPPRHWRSEGGAGRTGRHLLGAANGRKLFLKIHVKIQVVISYVFACKNKALQLQRLPILSILGYNIDIYFKQALQFPKPKTKGRQIWPPPRGAKGPATPLLLDDSLAVVLRVTELHHLLPHLNPDWFCISSTGFPQGFLHSWYRLTQVVLEKRPLNGCRSSSCVQDDHLSRKHVNGREFYGCQGVDKMLKK